MQQVPINCCWLDPAASSDLPLPVYASAMAAGMDVAAALTTTVLLVPGDIAVIPTGFAMAIPEGFEVQVRPRSGLAARYGVTVVNAPGTIDADYRGEVKVALINLGKEPFAVQRGDRIAQLVVSPVCQAHWLLCQSLGETGRGSGGFGSTGK